MRASSVSLLPRSSVTNKPACAGLVSAPIRRSSSSHERSRERKVSGTWPSSAFSVTLGSAAAKPSGSTFRTSTSSATASWCSARRARRRSR